MGLLGRDRPCGPSCCWSAGQFLFVSDRGAPTCPRACGVTSHQTSRICLGQSARAPSKMLSSPRATEQPTSAIASGRQRRLPRTRLGPRVGPRVGRKRQGTAIKISSGSWNGGWAEPADASRTPIFQEERFQNSPPAPSRTFGATSPRSPAIKLRPPPSESPKPKHPLAAEPSRTVWNVPRRPGVRGGLAPGGISWRGGRVYLPTGPPVPASSLLTRSRAPPRKYKEKGTRLARLLLRLNSKGHCTFCLSPFMRRRSRPLPPPLLIPRASSASRNSFLHSFLSSPIREGRDWGTWRRHSVH
jgi:hypothetical protein